ncbi:MAG TPA: TetR family transcriptional regulator [Anaerolineales bacterium]|nr:TetR family transcriptional regulator [Anaerolineales bacterium]HND48148.1 TetR family transcriptional regulator [Anaerolineales bacterium]
MKKTSPTKRKYDSSRRQTGAAETRQHIMDATLKLFVERGYAGATIDAIAKEAGVALKTVYAVFENKRNILVALLSRSSSSTGEENIPMLERSGPKAVAQERDQRRQIQMFAQVIAGNLEGAAYIAEIIHIAAKTEADVATLEKKLNEQRWKNMAYAVKVFSANGTLRVKDEASATETVYTLTSPEVFLLLTRERGLSKEEYIDWLADILTRALLP